MKPLNADKLMTDKSRTVNGFINDIYVRHSVKFFSRIEYGISDQLKMDIFDINKYESIFICPQKTANQFHINFSIHVHVKNSWRVWKQFLCLKVPLIMNDNHREAILLQNKL